ncbi:MAG TPA: adenylate/guanylate cyclase domain-containing protein [Rhodospirillaceae bacterium]|nr:adenylate/guanylate cyclase domain-containing protein [Rhodospirillaceae bacterium]
MRGILAAASIVIVASGISLWMVERLPFVRMGERWIADYRVATLLAPEPQHPDIVIVAVTEDTLSLFPYRSPIDRRFLAGLVKTLEARGARALALDVLFDQPTEPEKDDALRQALGGLSIPAVVSYVDQQDGETDRQQAFLDGFLPPGLRAMANLSKDPYDGTVRSAYGGRVSTGGEFIPGLSIALAKKLGVAGREGGFDIAWRGAPNPETPPFANLPANTVSLLPVDWVRNKVVFIGSDLSLTDRHRTPFSTAQKGVLSTMPGVEIHAHIFAQLMAGKLPPGSSGPVNLVLTAGAALLGVLTAMPDWRLGLKLAAALLNAATLWVIGFVLFHNAGIMLPLVTPTTAFATALTLAESYGNRQQRRERRFIHDAFTRYVAPGVVDQLIKDPGKLSLGGERRELTMMFTDISGFTRMSERIEAGALGVLLNSYLGGICDIVLAANGTIVEFIGDAVFAVFGAPVHDPDHAERALAAALAIDAYAERFRVRPEAAHWGWGETRIGVHKGIALVGNFGGERRFKYVPVGDSVNTAARIEGLNKFFGTRICVSAATLTEHRKASARPLGRVIVKGRDEATEVFELLQEDLAPSKYFSRYRRAYDLLDRGEAATAATMFDSLAAENSDDHCVGLHLARIRAGHRDTVIVMDEK